MSKYERLTYYLDEQCTMLVMPRRKDRIEKCIERLSELEDKIESGKLVELPCKVGDTVYEVFKYHKPPFIQETTIEKIVITEKGFKLRLSRNSVYETEISSLGRTIFLTESEAEAKLKELQEKV